MFIAGAAVQWLRDGLGLVARADETEALARSVADTGGVSLRARFRRTGLSRTGRRTRAAPSPGLTRGTTRAHLVRAALEAMAFSSAELVELMTEDAGLDAEALRVDGGASANDWLMQFLADVLGAPWSGPT